MIVSKNPSDVWSVSAVPVYSGGTSSVMHVENCAESAITLAPHTSVITRSTLNGAPADGPMTRAQIPLIAIAPIVSAVRPLRSATHPPATHPAAPAASVANAMRAGSAGENPRAIAIAAQNAAIQLHIAYSSHMWPR